MTYHIRTLTGEKPDVCDICKMTLLLRDALSTHEKVPTGKKSLLVFIVKRHSLLELD